MIYHFVILSDEVDDFRREIAIDGEATFLEFHDTILKSCGYKKDQMTSFFICSPDWSKETEITLFEMNDDPNVRNWVMDKTHLDDLLHEEKIKLLFLFDTMCERYLFIQLKSIEQKGHISNPEVTKSTGKAPVQQMNIDDIIPGGFETEMYGDDDYDPSELDEEGFGDLESMESSGY